MATSYTVHGTPAQNSGFYGFYGPTNVANDAYDMSGGSTNAFKVKAVDGGPNPRLDERAVGRRGPVVAVEGVGPRHGGRLCAAFWQVHTTPMPSPSESVVTAFFHASRAQAKKRRREIPGMDRLVASMVARALAEEEMGAAHEPERLPSWFVRTR